MFYDPLTFKPTFPVSFWIALHKNKDLPHIDYYVGKSNHISEEKRLMIQLLKEKGSVWSWECEECKEKVVKRMLMELDSNLYPFSVHPELYQLITQEATK